MKGFRSYLPNIQHRPLQQEPFTRWFFRQGRITKIGCVCFSLIGMLILYSGCGAIGNAANADQSTTATVPTTIAVMPSDTPTTFVQAVLPKNTPTTVPLKTSTPKPTPRPTPKPQPTHVVPTPTPAHTGVNGNPWGYDFNPGHLIYYPPNGFCNYFKCIPSFKGSDDPGDGYIIECRDQTYSQSGGERGACSYHGGELRPLYSH